MQGKENYCEENSVRMLIILLTNKHFFQIFSHNPNTLDGIVNLVSVRPVGPCIHVGHSPYVLVIKPFSSLAAEYLVMALAEKNEAATKACGGV